MGLAGMSIRGKSTGLHHRVPGCEDGGGGWRGAERSQEHGAASWDAKASGNVGRLCSDSRSCERVCMCMCVCKGGGQPRGMPADLAACAICLEVEENKNNRLLGAREAQGARRTGHGGGEPLCTHTEAPSALSRSVHLLRWHRGAGQALWGSCGHSAPRTPCSTAGMSVREERVAASSRSCTPQENGCCACCLLSPQPPHARHAPPHAGASPAPPLTQLLQLGCHGLGPQRQGGAGRSLGRRRS